MSKTTPPPIPTTTTIAEVVDALGTIIDWSIKASSRLGYFAALYKRITIAVGVAVEEGKFEDGARLERLDAGFANRYFDALNGHFHPGRFPRPTHSWQVTFDAAGRPEPILVQHMFAGVNAHIGLDLGIVAEALCPGSCPHCARKLEEAEQHPAALDVGTDFFDDDDDAPFDPTEFIDDEDDEF